MTDIRTTNHLDRRQLSRREFLRIGGLAVATIAALLAGCRPSTSDQTTSGGNVAASGEGALASGQSAASAAAVAATATPTATAQATATPVPQQTAPSSQSAAPTATPATAGTVYVACPRGLINDPYPGHCKLYRDSDGNGYCDWSLPGSGNVPAR